MKPTTACPRTDRREFLRRYFYVCMECALLEYIPPLDTSVVWLVCLLAGSVGRLGRRYRFSARDLGEIEVFRVSLVAGDIYVLDALLACLLRTRGGKCQG